MIVPNLVAVSGRAGEGAAGDDRANKSLSKARARPALPSRLPLSKDLGPSWWRGGGGA